MLFIAFLNSHEKNKLYAYDLEDKKIAKLNNDLNLNFLDFIWSTDPASGKVEYYMYSTIVKDSSITLQRNLVTLKSKSEIYFNPANRKIEDAKSNYYSFFIHNNTFYWVNFNNDKDFTCGYSNTKISTTDPNININKIDIISHEESPLKFEGDSKIEKLKFIRNTKYAYYKIINNNKNYYGIIDIRGNKVIFNTDEDIKVFKPLTNHSLLAITEDSAYEVCLIKDSNNKCVSECSSSKIVIVDSVNHNHCGSQNEKCSEITLYPENICVNSCDTTLFELNESTKKCGLCKYIYEDKIYKVINETGCISNINNGFYIIDKNLNIVGRCHSSCKSCSGPNDNDCESCNRGYDYEDGRCIENIYCYDNCKKCTQNSEDPTNQYCTECYDDLFFQNDTNNCLEICPEGYFIKDDKYCLKCDESCVTCKKDKNLCTKCKNEYYFNDTDNYCYKCDDNCKTCSYGKENDNENCLTCFDNKYLVNAEKRGKNCVEVCPDGTSLKNNECVIDNTNYMIIIFFILLSLIIIVILYNIVRVLLYKRKNRELSEKINEELEEKAPIN